ncbi:urease accessory protein UreE [Novosphingobium sp. Leaf2]|uniref:urease accessory protein UreE n=1 Tax=Novosphingobium sp. Leaf2 TaxID=1735670 RepID=UPI0006F8CA01|nr:urease accessory protein UreE [Novosphingobium sp. Leaf2]KQM14740.1 urease accessory protein UreE [Novosphingobium sp. Leaf2]
MQRIITIIPGGGAAADDVVELDHDHRRRRRIVHATRNGRTILLDQPNVVHLRDGDGLQLEDGAVVAVQATPEHLIAIGAPDIAALVRIAWHLGNRHLPTQLAGETLLIRADHVIAHMVEGLGGTCRAVLAPFDPEGGAYAGGGHGDSHSNAHSHAHGDAGHDGAHDHHHHAHHNHAHG